MKKSTLMRGLLLCLLAAAPCVAFAAGSSAAKQCERSLDTARKTEYEGGQAEKALGLYAEAFELCDRAVLPVDLAARLAVYRGTVQYVYQNDDIAALETYAKGLEAVTAAKGIDDPARIALLEGMANVLGTAAARGSSTAPGADQARALELYEEALRVRGVAYGEHSPEVAQGLVLLAGAAMWDDPTVAESYARRAYEVASERGAVNPQAAAALSVLHDAYVRQGKATQADEAQEMVTEIYGLLEAGNAPGV